MDHNDLINKLYNLVIINTKGEEQILLLNEIKKLKSKLTNNEKINYNINMENDNFKIMFNDLNEEAQKELLSFYGIESPEEMNLDVFPLSEILKEEDE